MTPADIEIHSSTWSAVREWAQAQVNEACRCLEDTGMDPINTALMRGRIRAFRELIDLPNPKPPPVVEAHDTYGI